MPKPLHVVRPRAIGLMKDHISQKASVPLNSKADCMRLSRIIEVYTKNSISASTLYRIFLHPRPTTPYLHTLDVLAEFCGFENWLEFEKRITQTKALDLLYYEVTAQQRNIDSLIRLCIHQNQLGPFLAYAAQFPFPVDPDMGYRIGFDIYQALWDNPNKNKVFFKLSHQLPLVRRCFFTMMVDQDFELKDYETGVKQFVSTAKNGKSSESMQEYILGNCLLFRHYFLNDRHEEALEIGKRLYRKNDVNFAKADVMSLETSGRYLAYRFWYYLLQGQTVALKRYTIAIRDLWYKRMNSWSYQQKKGYLYFFGDVFTQAPSLSHLEVLLKSHFCSFLETMPGFDFEKPLAFYLPSLDISMLTVIKRGGNHELSPIWNTIWERSKHEDAFCKAGASV
jgi:hypothetical protein